jgi:phytanoyl-CoA hydroxylase
MIGRGQALHRATLAALRSLPCLSDAEVGLFRQEGFLVVRDLLHPDELAALREETLLLVQTAEHGSHDPDFLYKQHEQTGEQVPYRVEYVIDKSRACRALLGHPYVLRSVEKLQGPGFVPTWDSMVFKLQGAGAAVPWHRDQLLDHEPLAPIFNVDFYLDASDRTNCLYAVPGSHRLSNADARALVERLSEDGFRTEGAVALALEPGDVLLHDILLVHGSPPARSGLRRVLYYEFRSAEEERVHGPHVAEYPALKRRVLHACLRERAAQPYAFEEQPYASADGEDDDPPTLRYAHADYWRAPTP